MTVKSSEKQKQNQAHLVRALAKLQVIAIRNSDWFMSLFDAVVIGHSNYFGRLLFRY